MKSLAILALMACFGQAVPQVCESVRAPAFQNCVRYNYNMTVFPNLMGNMNQEEAGMEMMNFYPLVKVQCSPDLLQFLCTLYAPPCTLLESPVPPCRELCESAKNGCSQLMAKFGFQWPASFNCDKFPLREGLCLQADRPTTPNPEAEIEAVEDIPPEQICVCLPTSLVTTMRSAWSALQRAPFALLGTFAKDFLSG